MIHLLYAIFYLLLVFSPMRKMSRRYSRLLISLTILAQLFIPNQALAYLVFGSLLPVFLHFFILISVKGQFFCLAFSFCRLMNFLGFDRKRLQYLLALNLGQSYQEIPNLSFKSATEFSLILRLCQERKSWQQVIEDYECLNVEEQIAYADLYTEAKKEKDLQVAKCENEL